MWQSLLLFQQQWYGTVLFPGKLLSIPPYCCLRLQRVFTMTIPCSWRIPPFPADRGKLCQQRDSCRRGYPLSTWNTGAYRPNRRARRTPSISWEHPRRQGRIRSVSYSRLAEFRSPRPTRYRSFNKIRKTCCRIRKKWHDSGNRRGVMRREPCMSRSMGKTHLPGRNGWPAVILSRGKISG